MSGHRSIRSRYCQLRRSSSAAHALFRTAETRRLAELPLPPPVLDFGCGDGSLGAACFPWRIDLGVDLRATALKRAKASGAYDTVLAADGHRLPLADESFGSVLSISVFEHLRQPAEILAELHRVLRPGGSLVCTITLSELHRHLFWPRLAERARLPWLGRWYVQWQNRLFSHGALFDEAAWRRMLLAAGFQLESCRPIISPPLVARWDRGLPAAAAGRWWKTMTAAPGSIHGAVTMLRKLCPRLDTLLRRRRWRALWEEWRSLRPLILDDTQPGSVLLVVARKPGSAG